ncbi:hypothetical protein HBA54_24225 [Pelagibius litoralis]|uniref:Uncharacterized protein n=1 Tax=Pelagibius litoralis TaxID=374515 RepID=A0A967F261_9PROT|nr:hypothetical protein [Pelagibius litoralis]NIA71705.1 hypothetical protein [Pelagibius litoralis]
MDHETALINAFVLPAKRERALDQLANHKRRRKFLESLYHYRDLDPRYRIDIAPADQQAETIFSLLTKRGASAQCHLISSDRNLDGFDIALSDALAKVVGLGEGTLVSCIPGRLGYFEGESPGDRFILERTAP